MGYKFNPFTGNLDVVDTTAAAGATTQVQFNDAGAFGGDSGLTFNKTTDALSAGGFIPTSSTVPANGVYLPAANSVGVATNGTGRLFVDASGNVLVNDSASITSNATGYVQIRQTNVGGETALTVINSSNSDSAATVKIKAGQATRNGGEIVFGKENAGNWASTALADGYIAFAPVLNNSNTERLRITSAGLVGIGTSAPGTSGEGAGLRVHSYLQRTEYYSPAGYYAGSFGYTNNTQDRVWLAVDSNYSQGSAVSAGIFLSSYHQDTGGSHCGYTIKDLRADGALVFSRVTTAASLGTAATETERLRITSAGLVGVGTSSPVGKLAVGNSSNNFLVSIDSSASYAEIQAYNAPLYINRQGNNTILNSGAGNVGIGTSSPSEKLDVYAGSLSVGSEYVSTLNTDYKMRLRSVGAATNNNYLVEIGASGSGPQPSDSDLTLATRTWNGSAYATTEKARLTATGRLGIGTTSPAQLLHLNSPLANATQWIAAGVGYTSNLSLLANGSGGGLLLSSATDSSASIINSLNAALTFGTNNTERARIDSSGRLLVGTSSARGNFFNVTNITPGVQIEQTDNGGALSIVRQSADAGGAFIALSKSRGTTVGSNTLPANGDDLGAVFFLGSDGSEFVAGAGITAQVDGTPGANDMPGRLVFSTTADGAASSTERLRITSAGVLQVADAGDITVGTTTGTKIGTATTQKLGFWDKTPVVQPTTGISGATFDLDSGVSIRTNSTYDGYTIAQVVAALRQLGILA